MEGIRVMSTITGNCKKCGRTVSNLQYHTAANGNVMGKYSCKIDDISRPSGEHLHFYCECGFDWVRKTEDNITDYDLDGEAKTDL